MVKLENLRIGQKIKAVTFFIIVAITVCTFSFYYYEYKIILEKAKTELYNANNSIVNMVKTSTKISVRSYLKALAEGNIAMINDVYEDYRKGKYTKEEAMELISKVVLAQKIGKSGYTYIVNSKGIVLAHPYKRLENTDISEQDFFKNQAKSKKGYMEYEWKNPGDLEKRKKALYMEYFEEWDLIVSVTAYREEFEDLVNPADFRNEVLSVKFGEKGYSYIINDKGIVKIHPNYETGTDWYNTKDSKGNEFIKKICEEKNGSLSYFWKTLEGEKEEEKIVFYKYIPELKWIVVSGSYKKDYLKPVNDMRTIIAVVFFLLMILYMFQRILLEKLVVKPVQGLILTIRQISKNRKNTETEIKNRDEIKELLSEFNMLIHSVEDYENHLKEMVEKRTEELIKTNEKLKIINYTNEKNEVFLDTLFQTIPDPVFYKDEKFRYMKFNTAFEKYIGKTKEEIWGKTVYEIYSKELADVYNEKDSELFNNYTEQKYESLIKNASGEYRDVILNKAVCFIEKEKIGIIGVIQDVSEFRKMEKRLKEQSLRDQLTGLYNRRGLEELQSTLFGYSVRKQEKIAVFMIDIDNFKLYNDRYGHQAGDICLQEIGKTINACCYRTMDFAGRYGGEEFIVILTDIDEKGALEVAERIGEKIRTLNIEHLGNLREKIVTVSIGIYINVPDEIENVEKFIQNADQKLYTAKAKGKGRIEI